MKILNNTFAIFWRFPDSPQQFHADGIRREPTDGPAAVVSRFRSMFPDDVVCSVRDASGRFVAFKESAQ